ncbi:MAG TPA: sensor histidine kinase, partial [Pseudomonadaceae bacterium]|nr:sensor histidine kinase [Pseudomonadaceae bacterium]
ISDEAYRSVRNLMAWLRPAILDELGLNLALQQMVDDWNVHHDASFCALRLDTDLSDLSAHRQIQVYRIVQEALTNVVKHAQAERVSVTILGDDQLELVITDDGRGFDRDTARTGIGLANIRDRANLLQGQAHVRSASGEGTILQITFPREENPEQELDDGE